MRVNSAPKARSKSTPRRNSALTVLIFVGLCSSVLFYGFPVSLRAQSAGPPAESAQPAAPHTATSASDLQLDPQSNQQTPGTISGIVLDQSGAAVAGAQATLTRENQPPSPQVTADDGQFSFANIAPALSS